MCQTLVWSLWLCGCSRGVLLHGGLGGTSGCPLLGLGELLVSGLPGFIQLPVGFFLGRTRGCSVLIAAIHFLPRRGVGEGRMGL